MKLVNILRRCCEWYLRTTETLPAKEPKLNEAQRRTVAEVELRKQMTIEPLSYARPRSQEISDETLTYLQDFGGAAKLEKKLKEKELSSSKRGRIDK